MSRAISEYEVENKFIDRLKEMGYEYVSMKNYDDVITNLRKQLCKVNAAKLIEAKGKAELSDREFERVMLRLDGHTVYESAKILREQWVLELDNGKSVYLEFLTEDNTRNTFQVTNQITMDKDHLKEVEYKNRYDVTILINGLPLIQVELKRPGVELNEAINQINRYRRYSFKGLFRFIQVFVVSNSVLTKYFANANENDVHGNRQLILKSLVFYWATEDNKRINTLMEFTNAFFVKVDLIEMLTKYYVIKESEPTLMVMRPYQIHAVKKAMHRVMVSDMNGFIFHTTGSGKTLTSFKLASLLRDQRQIDKVIFLIDRKDLDDQTVDEYNSFESKCVDNTDNTETLIKSLQDPTKMLIVSTIQKMANAIRSRKYARVMDSFRSKKVIFIIDECHRSQFGKMHSDIQRHFTKANYIGFTGTPIFKENKSKGGRTTADVFRVPEDMESCIHRYMIKEAIADGNVLRFSVEYMRSVNINRIDDSSIDISKLDDPDYCKRQKIDMGRFYHDPERIGRIATDILTHLESHTHPSGNDIYTAIFATDKIQYLMEYYRYMKAHNPKNYRIAAIFTFQQNEDLEDEGVDNNSIEYLKECMDDYNKMFQTEFDISAFDAYRRDISKRMKQNTLPQIDLLLVVNMFLTGFDSKATNTLILDKDLAWHSLVQAYSRTNRVNKVTKQFGQIITYRNIKKAQDDALRLYSGDGNPNDYLLESYEYYITQYRTNSESVRAVAETPDDAGFLQSEDDQSAFIIAFRILSSTLATLKTFSKFDWADLDMFMDEEAYMAYKSWYLEYYDKQKRNGNTSSVLADIDFDIELIRVDSINVVYILNLLKEINRKDRSEMEKSIDLIMREIDRSDNEKLRYKREIMKAFIKERFFSLDPEEDLIIAYEEYEKESMQARIEAFATENNLEPELIAGFVSEYFMNPRGLTRENMRQSLKNKGLDLFAITRVVENISKFVKEMSDLYTAEGV